MKNKLRVELRGRLHSLSVIERRQFSNQACALLKKQPIWQSANVILFYAPLANEVDVWPLFSEAQASGKIVSLPKFVDGKTWYVASQITDLTAHLAVGQFGIREPNVNCPEISLNSLDLALVPGLGFDLMGRRLGRGKGFYDRLLAQISGTKCGVGFDEQIVEAIPTEPHDVCLNCILTPTRWVNARPARGSNEFFG
ncbi:MAG: 5-formyltetrahydrofolate cyclo-ligase [Verrucomicrobiota bacterium]